MSGYYSVEEEYGMKPVTDINTADFYPMHNIWRNNPLSGRSIVRANVAGYYPYPKYQTTSPSFKENDWKMAYSYVCSTIFPANPQFKDKKEIILYR